MNIVNLPIKKERRKAPLNTKSIADDGESMYSKYCRGEIRKVDYESDLVKKRGFENSADYNRQIRHKKGTGSGLSMSENKKCSDYLGVHICENKEFLSKIINILESMPNGNPGYDIICKKDKKVDVKCACLKSNDQWAFHIKKNKIADYFLMIAFDNRENLNVQHIWLVKGDVVIEKTRVDSKEFIVNEKNIVGINKGNRALKRWIKYEITDTYKLEEVQKVCNNFNNNK